MRESSELKALERGEVRALNAEREDRKSRKIARASTAGEGWFHMKAGEMNEEAELSLKAVAMRDLIYPKKFYKASDHGRKLPKFFAFGRVKDDPLEF